MCGICGWVDTSPVDRTVLSSMTSALTHRGPDFQNTYISGMVGLGHTRLSILDLSPLGNQPMHSKDGKISIVFNGEFYDFQRYRNQLISEGESFRSHSDTEVIISLYRKHGLGFLDLVRGMFALAIWDHDKQRLVMARDRVGKKPLYYYHENGRLLFASEIKSILEHPGFTRRIDPEALDMYFRLGYIPHELSIFEGVKKLMPGHSLVYENNNIYVEKYWDLPGLGETRDTITLDEATEELDALLKESIDLRLVSDVPVGVFLSGGTDSSLIATLATQQSDERLNSFSIGFSEQRYNELPYARQIADHIGSKHHEHIVALDEISTIESLAPYYDEPFADPSLLPTYLVSKMAREHVKVALSGDGGDELFGGYNWYDWVLRHNRLMRIPSFARKMVSSLASVPPSTYKGKHFLTTLGLDEYHSFLERTSVFYDGQIGDVLLHDISSQMMSRYEDDYKNSGLDTLTRLSRTDFHYYLPDDILTKVDRASMAVSLEARVPLLDHRICEFAFSLPSRLKIRDGQKKMLLKSVARRVLPGSFDYSRKQGFVIPLKEWMAGKLGDHLEELLNLHDHSELLNVGGITKLLSDHRRNARDNSKKLWAVYMYCHWKQGIGNN